MERLDVTADKGFCTGRELKECEENGITTYFSIPDETMLNKALGVPDPEFYSQRLPYDPLREVYICPANQVMGFWKGRWKNRGRLYSTGACSSCPLRGRCTRNKLGRYIGDPHRFPSFDHVASFLGIIPVSKDSANVRRRGRMSKEGPSVARWLLGVMVDNVARRNPEIKRYYQSVKERSGPGHAHVMTMKKLNRMLYHMLITRQRWKWEDERLTERKLSYLSPSATMTNEGGVTTEA
ncbi:MAG: transposase [Nitrososphaerota archaeon]|nr:transposase [Nitrososphaerota archaeon]MDG7026393.1 transposase [Nitrososphaerota archaeon]